MAAPQGKPDVMASLLNGVEARSHLFSSADAFYLEEVYSNHALPGIPAEQKGKRKDELYQKRFTVAGCRLR